MTLEEFKKDCIEEDPDVVVQKYLIEGSSFFFNEFYNKNEEFKFKKELARSLGAHIRDIAVVGSGKLGYSIKPDRDESTLYQFKRFDYDYAADSCKRKSDLDIAIISGDLFDKQLVSIFDHTDCYTNIEFNKQGKRSSFAKYILRGWLNTKFIPEGYVVSDEIMSTQKTYSDKYAREINYAIYKSWYFFEKYHINNVYNLKLNLIASS